MDLRSHLEAMRAAKLLDEHINETDIWDIPDRLLESGRATLFTQVDGYAPVVGNLMNTREKLALALNCSERDLLAEYCRRVSNTSAPAIVSGGPVKEVCRIGTEVDLTAFPFMLQHKGDGGPYISSAIDFSRKSGGGHNLGMRRLMLLGKRSLSFNATSASDLRTGIQDAVAAHRPFEVAFAMGMHPAYYMAALARTPVEDELSLISGLLGEPVRMVKCETLDVLVPANAELVIEGTLSLEEDKVTEGPYGEILGAYGGAKQNYVMQVSAITHRRDMIFETMTSGGDRIWETDAVQLSAVRAELSIWSALCQAVPEPVCVYCPPAAGPGLNARASIRRRNPGDGKNALLAMLSCLSNVKYALVTDADVDIFDDRHVERALAMRVQPDRDLIVLSGTRTMGPDPSLAGRKPPVTGSKFGIDATNEPGLSSSYAMPPRPLEGMPPVPSPEDADMEAQLMSMLAQSQDGLTLHVIRTKCPGTSWRTLIAALAGLWDKGSIYKNAGGKYAICGESGSVGM